MSEEQVFVDGMIAKKPSEKAPDFIIANVSIKMRDLIEFAKTHHKDGWINVQIKEARSGKFYAALDTFKPSPQQVHDDGMAQVKAAAAPAIEEDDIPF